MPHYTLPSSASAMGPSAHRSPSSTHGGQRDMSTVVGRRGIGGQLCCDPAPLASRYAPHRSSEGSRPRLPEIFPDAALAKLRQAMPMRRFRTLERAGPTTTAWLYDEAGWTWELTVEAASERHVEAKGQDACGRQGKMLIPRHWRWRGVKGWWGNAPMAGARRASSSGAGGKACGREREMGGQHGR